MTSASEMTPDTGMIETTFSIPLADTRRQLLSSHRLCAKCREIFFNVRLNENVQYHMGQHHESATALRDSALGGCQLCLLVWTTEVIASQDEIQKSKKGQNQRQPIGWTVGGFAKSTHTDWFIEFYPVGKLNTTLYLNRVFDAPLRVPKSNGSNNTGSEISLNQAREWLSQCLETHTECAIHAKSEWVPTRLLYIDPSGSHLRLRFRDEILPGTRYISLSHCWGQHQPLRLLQDDIDAFRASIATRALPKTFCDAVAIVRALGQHYIWIDSLCIIQDSAADWRAECTVMGLVYRNALCNIAATSARDGTVGCFFERAPTLLEDLTLTLTPTADREAGDDENNDDQPMQFVAKSNATSGLFGAHAPLYQRGWVIQEWYMAPRVLHFGRDLIFWECVSGAASEALPDIVGDGDGGAGTGLTTVVQQLPKSAYRKLDAASTAAELMDAWKKLVAVYTAANLTKGSDRLPAFSAIAREMAGRWRRVVGEGERVEYLAGMWSVGLPLQLLWKVSRPDMGWSTAPARPLDGYVAPTWSWASVTMPVFTYMWCIEGSEGSVLMKVVESGVVSVGDDPFLEITGGFIRVESMLWKLPKNVKDGLQQSTAQNPLPFSLSLEYDEKEELWSSQMQRGSHIYLAPVKMNHNGAQTANEGLGSKFRAIIEGLVLARNDNAKGQYARIGCFTARLQRDTTSLGYPKDDNERGERDQDALDLDLNGAFDMARDYLHDLGVSDLADEEIELLVEGSTSIKRCYQIRIV